MQLLSLPAFLDKIALGRSTAYVLMRDDPTFPRPIRISARRIAFDLNETETWIAGRIATRDGKGGAA